MIRSYFYLLIAGIVWLVEGFLFSFYLGFAAWQTFLLGIMYVGLFVLATRRLLQAVRDQPEGTAQFSAWRLISLAPMLAVIVGSFASLPLVVFVAILGKL